MTVNLNKGQRDAVYTRGKDLMVSASAGTGKTFSLCMRILEKLREKENPASLDRMLIVTFTRAAASELRKKLAKELKKAYEEESDPQVRDYLKRQRSLLPGARIGTIDSFYLEVVTAHFDELGISPKIRLAGGSEMYSLKRRLMKKAMARMYSGERREDFERLVGNMISGYTDSRLIDTFIKIYETTQNRIEGAECLKKASEAMAREAELPFDQGLHGGVIVQRNRRIFDFFARAYRRFFEVCTFADKSKAAEVLENERALWENCRALAEDPAKLMEFVSAINIDTRSRLFSQEYKDDPEAEYIKTVRKLAKEFIKDASKLFLDTDLSKYRLFFADSARLTDCLYALLSGYGAELFDRKKKNGVMEFSDVARMTCRLLYRDGEKTDIARRLSEEIDELYIDEYQDVNELQDRIFSALSRNNRFVVGDVKQSIYRFRGACPEIFNSLRDAYPDVEHSNGSTGRVFLKENYRSSKEVLAFVNGCIGPLMRVCTDINYMDEDDLIPGKDISGPLPAFCYVDKKSPKWKDEKHAEAVYVAKSLRGIIAEGINAGDIAVLVRGNDSIPMLRKALEEEGIPVDSVQGQDENFFESPEVLLLRCLIESVDNPTKDICLVGAMKSPVFGFTLDELAQIRSVGEGESFFSALNDYTAKTGDARCTRVLSFISSYRRKAQEYPADTLIYRMMDDLMLLPLLTAGKDAAEAERIRNNILAFYDMIRTVAAGGGRDLGRMIARLVDMADAKEVQKGGSEKTEGKVRIMTIHASKGLEFEVCWLYGAERKIIGGRKPDLDPELGYAFGLQDMEIPWLQNKTAVALACAAKGLEQEINEELRLLYVALTRAVKRLYVSGSVSAKMLENLYQMETYPMLDFYLLEKNASYFKWMKMALKGKKQLYREFVNTLPFSEEQTLCEGVREGALMQESSEAECGTFSNEEYVSFKRELEERLNFVYPHEASVDLPAKKAVSLLSPAVLDYDEDHEEFCEVPLKKISGVKPKFYLQRKGVDAGGDWAAHGSATHAFMQFCDFGMLESEGFDGEAKRLVEQRFLSPEVVALVEKQAVMAFLHSRLFRSLKSAGKIYREQRFMIELPAEEFTYLEEKKRELKGEKLLVQGVIDCFFEDKEGNLVLFDYKTDHFSFEERKDPKNCAKILKDRHAQQLEYYKEAVKRMMGRSVDRCYIYSFALNREIEV